MKDSPVPSMAASEKKYRAESDLRTLTEAHEIGRDASRLKPAHQVARKQMTALRRVTGKR